MSSLQTTIQNTITEEDPQRSTKLIKMGSNKSFIENNFGSSVQNGGHTQQTTRTDITSQAREQEAAVDEDNRLLTLDYQYRDGNAIAMNTPVTGSFGRSERGSSPLEGPITSAQSLYRFEWFRLLIAQVLLASLGIALGIVFLFSTTRPEPDVVANLATTFLGFLGLPILWAFTCVLSQLRIACQGALKSACADNHTRRQYLYRISWYTWFFCIIASMVMLTTLLMYAIGLT